MYIQERSANEKKNCISILSAIFALLSVFYLVPISVYAGGEKSGNADVIESENIDVGQTVNVDFGQLFVRASIYSLQIN